MPDGNLIPWPVTRAQYHRACELVAQLREAPEGSDLYFAIVDDLKSIPGYPRNIDPDLDLLYFKITDLTPTVQRR